MKTTPKKETEKTVIVFGDLSEKKEYNTEYGLPKESDPRQVIDDGWVGLK